MNYDHDRIKPTGIVFSSRNMKFWTVEKNYINDIFIVVARTSNAVLVFKKTDVDNYQAYGRMSGGTIVFISIDEAEKFVDERLLYEL